ncbi:hypothetical protein KAU45_08155 [bacterium]|nr:hypothetical protein [bacterium]
MERLQIALILLLTTGLAAAFVVEPELYGAYRFVFANVEYDTPPAPRSDERTYLLQRLEVGVRWPLLDWVVLEAGLELEHDVSDALEYDSGNWDNFCLNPRLRLEAGFGDWGVVRLGHFDPGLGPETIHTEPYDHPAAGFGWWGDNPEISWSLFGARMGRVTEDTKEVFLAGGSVSPRFDLGAIGLVPHVWFAYRHAGGYDTAGYQGYEPPDGVRKEELWNLGGGVKLSLFGKALYLGGGYFASLVPGADGRGELIEAFLGGGFWWLDLRASLYLGEGYRGIRPMPALVPCSTINAEDSGELRFLDLTLTLNLPLPYGAVGRVEVRQGFFFDPDWSVPDNRNRLTLLLDFVF